MKIKAKMILSILTLFILASLVPISLAVSPEKTSVVWRVETEQVEPEIIWITETLALQIFDQSGNVFVGTTQIGTIEMQIRFLIDTVRLAGHANVKFSMSTDYGEVTGVMNGKIWYEESQLVDQFIDGRFVGNGDFHIHGDVSNLLPPQIDTLQLSGYMW